MKLCWLGLVLAVVVVFVASCSNHSSHSSMSGHDTANKTEENVSEINDQPPTAKNAEVLSSKEIHIVAREALLPITDTIKLPVYTFNGSVPGAQIRIKQGDRVKIHVKNELLEPITIHWHGYPVPFSQDGVPGITMDAILPGESHTYEFTATIPGTYWYHSHQEGSRQVDMGLYGTLVVEPKKKENIDRDYTLVLDEWTKQSMNSRTETSRNNQSHVGHHNSSHGGHTHSGSIEHDMSMYDLFTINGKSGNSIEPLTVKKGEKIRLRIVNAGYMSHALHLHGHDFKVVATDGQPINSPPLVKDQLLKIAPGERYDIEFMANNPGEWWLEAHGDNEAIEGMKIKIKYEDTRDSRDQSDAHVFLPVLDITQYGKTKASSFTLDQQFDVEYTMDLGTSMNKKGLIYTINGKTYPDIDPIAVKKGDSVKVRFVNHSPKDAHPMHLHGHFFQILSKNGKPVVGAPLIKDTINILPGEEYIVAFKADNPGYWMFHCHDLHHASAGMVTEVKYKDFEPKYTPDPNNKTNKPE